MADINLPHFSLPFTLSAAGAVVVEQDSLDEIATCVEVVLRCPIGHRLEAEDFGRPDPEFAQAPVPTEGLTQAINTWEPRAESVLAESGDSYVEAVRRIAVNLQAQVR